MRELYPEDLADLRPRGEHDAFIFPFLGSGFRPSGIYVAYDQRLYPVLGRVLACTAKAPFEPGEVVVFRPNAYDWIHQDTPMRSFASFDTRAALARILGWESGQRRIEPLWDNVLVDTIGHKEQERTAAGLWKPEGAHESMGQGRLLAAGPDCRYVSALEAETTVLYPRLPILILEMSDHLFGLLRENMVLATLEQEAA